MQIRKILYPTDLSEGSANAIPYVADLTKHYNAKLYLLHVIYDLERMAGLYVPHVNVNVLYEEMEASARKDLEDYHIEGLAGHKDIEYKIVKGIPHEEILKFAEENMIDLIIIGTHSRKGIDRIIFGNTAEKVVRYSKCPVLTVGLPHHKG